MHAYESEQPGIARRREREGKNSEGERVNCTTHTYMQRQLSETQQTLQSGRGRGEEE
jgi:hypothetical protein